MRLTDLLAVWDGQHQAVRPTMLQTDSGLGLFYVGQVNWLYGDSGTGKTWIAAAMGVEELRRGGVVLWADYENPDPGLFRERMDALGVDRRWIEQGRLLRWHPTDGMDGSNVHELTAFIREHGVTLAVLDSLGEAFGLAGVDESAESQTAPWLTKVLRQGITDATGATVLVLDHTTIEGPSRLHPSGSKRKKAATTGAMFLIEQVRAHPFGRGQRGWATLTTAKDRHGHYRHGEPAATFVLDCTEERYKWEVRSTAPRSERDRAAHQEHIEHEARRVVELLAEQAATEDAALSRNVLGKALRWHHDRKARRDADEAIALALSRGCIGTRPGPRNSDLYWYVAPWFAPTEPTEPNRAEQADRTNGACAPSGR